MKAAARMDAIPFSGIRQIFEEVTRRERAGERIIHLEVGRPDFDTPDHIKQACKDALDRGDVHYSSNYGIPALREAIAGKFQRDNGLTYDPEDEIILTVGANEAVFMTMMAFLGPGDEVLVPDPCWMHYFFCARMAGATPVSVPIRRENDFLPDAADFRARITPRTRMMVVNTPNNPTGAVYPETVLRELAALAIEHDVVVLSDEIYEKMVYGDAVHCSMASLPGMRERTVTVNGFSKIYAMTGWRLGYTAADRELTSALVRIHQYTTVCANTFAQHGAVAALEGPQDCVSAMVREFDRRRGLVCGALEGMRGVQLARPDGAFYALPEVSSLGVTSAALAGYLLDEAAVALVPGTTLGEFGEGYIRLSYANSYENLQTAMERIGNALAALPAH